MEWFKSEQENKKLERVFLKAKNGIFSSNKRRRVNYRKLREINEQLDRLNKLKR